MFKNPCKNLVIFTVGLADPAVTDYTEIMEKSGLSERKGVFHLRGGIDYKKLSIVHRGMMTMMKKMTIGKRSYDELSAEDKLLVDTYGGQIDFTDKTTIAPLVTYLRALQG